MAAGARLRGVHEHGGRHRRVEPRGGCEGPSILMECAARESPVSRGVQSWTLAGRLDRVGKLLFRAYAMRIQRWPVLLWIAVFAGLGGSGAKAQDFHFDH